MAGTILQTPSLGDSDWSVFVTQVEKQRKGFMSISLTNYLNEGTAAIASGSIVEMSGSIYQFTETTIDYSAAGSVNTLIYINIVPDAAISTCTVVAAGTAPIWVDSKQGYYTSAASITRCIGELCKGATAGVYYYKNIYTQSRLQKRIIPLGEWNMDTTDTMQISHDLNLSQIRSLQTIIYNDLGTYNYPLIGSSDLTNSNYYGGGFSIGSGSALIYFARTTNGFFDSGNFNGTASTVANRGFIIIEYIR